MGACRRHELHDLKLENVKDLGSTILVTIPNRKSNALRTFTVAGKYCELCKSYMKLRPPSCRTLSFFVNYLNGRCTVQNVGINKFGNMGKEIASYLNLPDPDLYTGHCFRRSSSTVLVDADGDITTLKRRDGWRSSTAEAYEEKNSAVEVIDIKEEREEEELTSVEMKLETEEHSLSHLELDDEDVTSSVDETSEHFPQTETARLYTKTEEEDHGTGSSRFFQAAPLENGDCFTRDSTGSCDRTDALDAGVLQDTGLAIPVITELNNRHTSSNESIHKKPVKRAYIPDFETEESKHLTTPELQRLLLIEQLKLTRLQTAFYEKRMKALSQ